ncbi:ABC transporter substrate-binding protein [Streptococcus oricebi]|uniref:Sugar-binding protein n=1 Tax=Streptococcus oricebi TaxID=1547447 RepID=A0ABS5B4I0_9STRE|nr:extracellular solute-binding protein [Streptococcus oricebi]MBP2623586.1 sugar-binding protein [Streptococcus oricebi]
MKWRTKKFLVPLIVLVLLAGLGLGYWLSRRQVIIRLGIYAGSSWDVPTSRENRVLDKTIREFEKKYPNVKVVYESGITKKDYGDWLADQILKGEQPDLFMVPEDDFSLLAKTGALKDLSPYISQGLADSFYPVAYQAGKYQGKNYALPFESNPTMMCVNKDLLEREGIAIPESGWTLAEFYEICQKITKDTNGDGVIDQYGSTDYTWQQALVAYGGHLLKDSSLAIDSSEMHKALTFISKLEALNQHYNVSSNDFDEGKVAFFPMTLAQYRTYKPYPYHVAKYSSFSWTCIPMPADSSQFNATQVKTSLFGMSAKTKQDQLVWELMTLLCQREKSQQEVFEKSQGMSVLKTVVDSKQSKQILQTDDFGADSLTAQRLDAMMKNAVLDISREINSHSLKQLDYLLNNAIKKQEIDSVLPSIQKEIESR